MTSFAGHPQAMLTEIYIEALLVTDARAGCQRVETTKLIDTRLTMPVTST